MISNSLLCSPSVQRSLGRPVILSQQPQMRGSNLSTSLALLLLEINTQRKSLVKMHANVFFLKYTGCFLRQPFHLAVGRSRLQIKQRVLVNWANSSAWSQCKCIHQCGRGCLCAARECLHSESWALIVRIWSLLPASPLVFSKVCPSLFRRWKCSAWGEVNSLAFGA